MAERIVMPKAGMAMESGTIIKWLKKKGDHVAYGEPLLEIETDKTTMEVEALNEGYLLETLYGPGDEVPVVTTIGWIGQLGEEPPAEQEPASTQPAASPAQPASQQISSRQPAPPAAPPQAGKIPASPKARMLARQYGIDLAALYHGSPVTASDVERARTQVPKATPLAQRIAKKDGIDLSAVTGTGRNGKIFSRDLKGSAPIRPTLTAKTVRLSGMRKTIARRMLESHTQIPPVTLNSEADVTFLSQFRARINERGTGKISFNDLVVCACAKALPEFPHINASYSEDGILFKEDVNIGIAVAVEDGLIVPVVRNADTLTLSQISAQAKDLAAKARSGQLTPDSYTGGTFTVSNLGMFGITSFTPIVNLPEACILGVCTITERLVMEEGGRIAPHQWMGLSLTFDHRCVDGASGARFLQRIVELLENPMELVQF